MERTWSIGLCADWINVLRISDRWGNYRREGVTNLQEFSLIDIDHSEIMRLRLVIDLHHVVTGIIDLKNQREVRSGGFTTVSFDRMCGHHSAPGSSFPNGEVQPLRTLSVYG